MVSDKYVIDKNEVKLEVTQRTRIKMLMSLQPSSFCLLSEGASQFSQHFAAIAMKVGSVLRVNGAMVEMIPKNFKSDGQEVLLSRCNGHQAVVLLPALFIYRTVVSGQLQKNQCDSSWAL